MRLGKVVAGPRARWTVLGVWLVLALAFAPFAVKLTSVTNEALDPPSSSQSAQASQILQEHFPGGDLQPAILVYRRPGGLTSADRLRILSQ
ncbi:MAG: hypothetical protein WAK93_04415, partial [Solirubrobacteraceae bacterium]